jgi:hypothetical protein
VAALGSIGRNAHVGNAYATPSTGIRPHYYTIGGVTYVAAATGKIGIGLALGGTYSYTVGGGGGGSSTTFVSGFSFSLEPSSSNYFYTYTPPPGPGGIGIFWLSLSWGGLADWDAGGGMPIGVMRRELKIGMRLGGTYVAPMIEQTVYVVGDNPDTPPPTFGGVGSVPPAPPEGVDPPDFLEAPAEGIVVSFTEGPHTTPDWTRIDGDADLVPVSPTPPISSGFYIALRFSGSYPYSIVDLPPTPQPGTDGQGTATIGLAFSGRH